MIVLVSRQQLTLVCCAAETFNSHMSVVIARGRVKRLPLPGAPYSVCWLSVAIATSMIISGGQHAASLGALSSRASGQ